MSSNYLIAVIDTDREPHAGEFRHGTFVPSAEVRRHLYDLLARHGRSPVANAEMLQEARAAEGQVSRWDGYPARYCGFLVRYDAYPVPDLTREYGAGRWPAGPPRENRAWPILDRPGPAREEDWQELAGRYDTDRRFEHARKKIRDLGLQPGDPDGESMMAFLVSGDSGISTISDRAQELARYHALAGREDVAPYLTAYRPWQWVTETAKRGRHAGESYDRIERELLAEIAVRRQEGAA